MKKSFADNLEKLLQEATDFIKSKMKNNEVVELLSEEDVDSDKFYEQPVFVKVSKHDFYEEFSIVSVSKDKHGDVYVKGIGKGENRDEEEVSINDIEPASLCYLADCLNNK